MAKILVADDRSSNREFLSSLLAYRSHRVIEAKDGAEALDLIRKERPDLVVSDILMPVMDGYELLKNLRADPELARIPVIFWTAHYLEREARALAQQSGALDILVKPSDPEDVLRITDAALGRASPPAPPPDDFHRQHLELLTTKLAKKTDEAYWATLRLQALVEAIHRLALEKEPERLIDVACTEARELIGSASAIVGISEESAAGAERCCIHGAESRLDHTFCRFLRDSETVRHMLQGKRSRRFPSTGESGRLELGNYGGYVIESLLSIPLQSAGRIYGSMLFLNKVGSPEFSEEDESIAVAFADQIALAYQSARLISEVTRLNTRLTSFNAELKQYTEVAFHHLQEPLRCVLSFSHLLASRYRDTLDPRAGDCVDFIQSEALRMRSLIRDLGAYSQVTAFDELPMAPVSLTLAAGAAADACRPLLEPAGATVTIQELPFVKGEAGQLRQIFQHLIENAVKFRSAAAPVICVRTGEDDGFHKISVQDNGIGIALRHHEQIFRIFECLHGERTGGTGIGLALCRKIVERHGGRMWVESDGASGATFYFTLPVFPGAADHAVKP